MYAMNLKYSRLHKSKPFNVMFHRQPNDLTDYSKLKPIPHDQMINEKELHKKLDNIDNVVIPAIREQISKTQKEDNERFRKKHKIIENPYPIGANVMIKSVEKKNPFKYEAKYEGPFTIHGLTKNGSYILKDRTNELLARDVPTSHLKLVDNDNVENNGDHYEVEAIVDHRDKAPGYQYKVRWKGYKENDDTWESPEMFDDATPIRQYWSRRKVNERNKAPKTVNKRKIPNRNKKSKTKQM